MILSYLRTVILYLVLIAGMRLLGKRQIGQLEPSEFVLAMLIADLAAIPMQDNGIPLLSGLVPIVTILSLELTLSGLTMASVKFRRLMCGKPVILIENGRLVQENLRKVRITLDELTAKLRLKDVLDLTTVQYAILETNGNLSVFPYPSEVAPSAKDLNIHPKDRYLPVTIIADGTLSRENLRNAGKSEAWLRAVLRERGAEISDTFLLTVDGGDRIIWLRKEAGA